MKSESKVQISSMGRKWCSYGFSYLSEDVLKVPMFMPSEEGLSYRTADKEIKVSELGSLHVYPHRGILKNTKDMRVPTDRR